MNGSHKNLVCVFASVEIFVIVFKFEGGIISLFPLSCGILTCMFFRGARASIRDAGGLSALERAMEMGAITDEELFVLLSESD